MSAAFPSLKELVEAEIARRQEGDGFFPLFRFLVGGEAAAMTDVGEATKPIVADADSRQQLVVIDPTIADAVVTSLRSAYPRRGIYQKTIVESPMRMAGRPDVDDGLAVEAAAAVARAQERVAKLREAR